MKTSQLITIFVYISILSSCTSNDSGNKVIDLSAPYSLLINDTLVIGNDHIERSFLWNEGNLISLEILDKKNNFTHRFTNSDPDVFFPGVSFSNTESDYKIERIVENKDIPKHLKVTVSFGNDTLNVKKVFRIYQDSPAIGCDVFLKGFYPGKFTGEIKKKRISSAFVENLNLKGAHWELESICFYDETDNNNTLVKKQNTIAFTRQSKIKANLLYINNAFEEHGLFLLKEGPSYASQINYPGCDFLVQVDENNNLDASIVGLGIFPENLSTDKWVQIYGYATGVCRNTYREKQAALKKYQYSIRHWDSEREEMIMMNTWGDRGQDAKISEDFVLGELEAGAKLGITHLQLDDGWQTGRTANSAYKGGSLDNIWEKGDYWKVHEQRFPQGFDAIIQKANELGIEMALWFNPSTDNSYENWKSDADVLIDFYKNYGIRIFKIDGVIVADKLAETNFRAFLDRLKEVSDNEIIINLDVTGVAERPGYHYFNEYGNIFLENRYTDWGNYYPHWTLRNLWMLAEYLPTRSLQIEFLNKWRNTDKYMDSDPLAPVNIPFEYLFATTIIAQPLAWFEGSGLPEEGFAIAPVIEKYKEEMALIHSGLIFPIGNEPNGKSWTGFQSVKENHGYIIVYREFNSQSKAKIKTLLESGGKFSFEKIIGQGEDFTAKCDDNGNVEFTLPGVWNYTLYKYKPL